MVDLTDGQIADFFRRSYSAVDGLWFMKLEEAAGFEQALDIDVRVWQIMPKIQARKMKELTGLDRGVGALHDCLTTKFRIEGFGFTSSREADGSGFTIRIARCPWYDLLVKSKREHLAGTIGTRICNAEFNTWASEFGEGIRFSLGDQLCRACQQCVMRFQLRPL
ncbi:MAG TPA: DUF6125 family protein [Phycisphaerae bacterium]|nr:DUF6125 family protein [Phycisphaerae bacterium]HRY68031.1 DUF6125 family protein [Phycisphaerae bacterium]HSA28689.1 DUF6125 family protein [Phycisphaerae bacterium]